MELCGGYKSAEMKWPCFEKVTLVRVEMSRRHTVKGYAEGSVSWHDLACFSAGSIKRVPGKVLSSLEKTEYYMMDN